jgi:hypothetical protein
MRYGPEREKPPTAEQVAALGREVDVRVQAATFRPADIWRTMPASNGSPLGAASSSRVVGRAGDIKSKWRILANHGSAIHFGYCEQATELVVLIDP